MTTTVQQIAPRRELAQMLVGNQVQQALFVCAKLGIADLLRTGPMNCEELAKRTGVHADSLYRLLRALASFEVFRETDPRSFSSTPISALLESLRPDSMRAFALWSGQLSYKTFGELEYSVRTGNPAFESIYGAEFFDYLGQHPEDSQLFDDMMAWSTLPLVEVLGSYEFPQQATIVDIGGGRGDLLTQLLTRRTDLYGILVDGKRANVNGRKLIADRNLEDRCQFVCADIMARVPEGGDLYLLKSVIHGMDDRDAERVLGNCRRAMTNYSRLLLIEFVMPSGNDPFPGKLMDLLMLVGCRGRERTENEFRSLLATSGFRISRLTTTKFGYTFIEAS